MDTNGDARADIAFRYRFTRKHADAQFARVTRAELTGELEGGHVHEEMETDVLVEHASVSFGSEAVISEGRDGVRFFAGFRSDPFFFDLIGFLNGLKFTGSDFFIDKNVFGIALDLPNLSLAKTPSGGQERGAGKRGARNGEAARHRGVPSSHVERLARHRAELRPPGRRREISRPRSGIFPGTQGKFPAMDLNSPPKNADSLNNDEELNP